MFCQVTASENEATHHMICSNLQTRLQASGELIRRDSIEPQPTLNDPNNNSLNPIKKQQ